MGYRGKVAEQERGPAPRAPKGWTYAEICEELGVSRSSVSLWVRDVAVDEPLWTSAGGRGGRRGNLSVTRRPSSLQVAKELQIVQCVGGSGGVARLTQRARSASSLASPCTPARAPRPMGR